MRPTLRLLEDVLIDRILDEARTLLADLGVEIHNPGVLDLLGAHGARIDGTGQARLPAGGPLDRALATAPAAFTCSTSRASQTHDLGGDRVHFTPGSAAIHILDGATGEVRAARHGGLRQLREARRRACRTSRRRARRSSRRTYRAASLTPTASI